MTTKTEIAISSDESSNLPVGTVLFHGQYEIIGFVNSGGWGKAYLARNSLHQQVLLKECYPDAFCRRDGETVVVVDAKHQAILRAAVSSFLHEARQLATIKHPNVVDVHQVFEENSTAYIAMEFIEGEELLARTERQPALDPSEVLHITRRLLLAISSFHADHMLHRDIAPDNVILRADTGEPILIDFGAAKSHQADNVQVANSMITVKSGYSPPEFYDRNADQTGASDLYSLAATLYFVISGRLPADAEERGKAIAAGGADPNVSLGAGNHGDFPPALLGSIEKALSLDPKDRFQTAQEWLSYIDSEVKVVQLDRAPSPRQAPTEAVEVAAAQVESQTEDRQRSKFPALAAGLSVLALLAGGGYYFSASPSPDTAEPSVVASDAEVTSAEPAAEIAELAPVESTAPTVIPDPQPQDVVPAETPEIVPTVEPASQDSEVLSVSDQALAGVTPGTNVETSEIASSEVSVPLSLSQSSDQLIAVPPQSDVPEVAPSTQMAAVEPVKPPAILEVSPELSDELNTDVSLPSLQQLPHVVLQTPTALAIGMSEEPVPAFVGPELSAENDMPTVAVERLLPLSEQLKVSWNAPNPFRLSPRIDDDGRRVLTVRRVTGDGGGIYAGVDILEVQGQPLEQVAQFEDAMNFDEFHQSRLRLLIREPGSLVTATKFISLYQEGSAELSSGITIKITHDNGSWLHTVANTNSATSGLQPGDVLLGFDKLVSLPSAIEENLRQGQLLMQVAVLREDTVHSAVLSLARDTVN